MVDELLREVADRMARMQTKLASLQNADGGFRAFYCHDTVSGVWATAEIVHCCTKALPAGASNEHLRRGCDYLAVAQNEDGGWPFRMPGKSITDVTAWVCLALSHYGYADAVAKGIRYILSAQNNVSSSEEDGWGLTAFEPDRVYSTWIASYCLSRAIRTGTANLCGVSADTLLAALARSRSWLLSIKKADGSWGVSAEGPSHYTSTAVALLTLFMQGENPLAYRTSYEFLKSGIQNGLWASENEIVVTQEGYELSQDWFTSALCFRVMIFFSELGVAPIREVHELYLNLLQFIREDGGVSLSKHAASDLIWPIPYALEAFEKYAPLVKSKEREYASYLYQRRQESVATKKAAMQATLQSQFPFPVSHAFVQYQHELDYNRRFALVVQLYEVTIKYACVIGLACYLLARDTEPAVQQLLALNFKRPSLGDWATLLQLLLKHSRGVSNLIQPVQPQDILRSRRDYLDETLPRVNLAEALSAIVSLRNMNTGHGALRTTYEYKQMVELEEHRIYSLCDRLRFMASGNSFLVLASEYDEFGEGDRYKIRIFRGLNIFDDNLETASRLAEGQHDSLVRYIYFHHAANNVIVNLYPFVSYMFCEECKKEHFFFYNGLKQGSRVSYLSYECGHPALRDNSQHFQKRLSASGVQWATAE